ncbi:response regulator [Spongiibacter sp. KMU-158]|uniref:histidine kinase n=1 Tax=Spongiibacter pelagi TaxID=2760804 RepID=A0A927C189_9GAMM|nr:response regulator [Spongiibacter pelagi]MBD2858027.1 response regulator [Spongiibacter pelagi]
MSTESGGEQILLVDDNPTNLQVLFKTLEGSGYRLLAARDGEAALYTAKRAKPSLILLDVMMPGMDGFEVCEKLKADPETADIVVIFLSALTDSQSKVHGLAIGGVDYIAKPFQSDEVLARVRTHIKLHRLEKALARRNSELEDENQRILNAVEEAIFGLDVEGRITSMNLRAAQLTGWPQADVLGESLFQLELFPGDTNLNEALLMLCEAGVGLRKNNVALSNREGLHIPVDLSGAPRSGGGAVLVLRDISEWLANQRELELAREAMDQQRQHMAHIERLSTGGEMAAGIAHEVNQPLTAVSNYAKVAERLISDLPSEKSAKLKDVLEKITIQAQRASAVIQRMRSYVKKPSGAKTEITLQELLKDVISLAEVDSRVNGIRVTLKPNETPLWVYVDEVQIQQVALNLIRNAMESTAKADSIIPVAVTLFGEGNLYGFEVSDRGAGLDPKVEEQLFSPFVSSKEGGMGIGLSVSQSIMQGHGGDIRYRPHPEGGAIFRCELPAFSPTEGVENA